MTRPTRRRARRVPPLGHGDRRPHRQPHARRLRQTYDLGPLQHRGITGQGQTLGIVTLAGFDPAAPEYFWEQRAAHHDQAEPDHDLQRGQRPRAAQRGGGLGRERPGRRAVRRAWPPTPTSWSTRRRTPNAATRTPSSPRPARTWPTRCRRAGVNRRRCCKRPRRPAGRTGLRAGLRRGVPGDGRAGPEHVHRGGRRRRLRRRRGPRDHQPVGRQPGGQPVRHQRGRHDARRHDHRGDHRRDREGDDPRAAHLGLGLAVARLRRVRLPEPRRRSRPRRRPAAGAGSAATSRFRCTSTMLAEQIPGTAQLQRRAVPDARPTTGMSTASTCPRSGTSTATPAVVHGQGPAAVCPTWSTDADPFTGYLRLRPAGLQPAAAGRLGRHQLRRRAAERARPPSSTRRPATASGCGTRPSTRFAHAVRLAVHPAGPARARATTTSTTPARRARSSTPAPAWATRTWPSWRAISASGRGGTRCGSCRRAGKCPTLEA